MGPAGTCGWLCLPVLALVALHVSWVADQYVGSQDAVAADGEEFTVMAANLRRGEADPARVMDLARRHGADAMTLSEVTPQALSALRAEGLGRAFPHAAGRAAPEVAGTMVFSRHPLSRVTELDTTFGGWSMRVALPGGAIDVVAVHPPPPLREAREWRLDHATIRRAATALEGPVVVAGDFNATPDHRPMRELEGRGFEDAAERSNAGWQPTWPASGRVAVLGVAVPSMLRIDHVLVDDGIGVVDTDAVIVPGTDHGALFARLVLR